MLAVPGMREALTAAAAPVVAVSPLVGGRSLKGPTEAFMSWAGLAVDDGGIASCYTGLAQGMVVDRGTPTGPASTAGLVLHQTASSWPAIDLSREAQAAADENLANVTDAYARGAVSVTDLIDAQETSLLNGLSATDAKYGFMTDFVNVLRSMGDFEILLDPASREAWYSRVETWVRQHP